MFGHFFEHEKVTKAIKKKKMNLKRKNKNKKPCVTCGAEITDKPASRYQHRSRSRICFDAWKLLHPDP